MDLLEVSPFPAASPDTFAFVKQNPLIEQPPQNPLMFIQQNPPIEQPSQNPFIIHENTCEGPGIRETTRQQWEALKPLIHRIYIEEDKPFPYLARILRDEHGFEPTKRQFSRQVEKWEFRKNVSRSERRSILQRLPESVGEILEDRRLKSGKLKNWRRRYREELKEASASHPQEPISQEVQNGANDDPSLIGTGFPSMETSLPIAEGEGPQGHYGDRAVAPGVEDIFDSGFKQQDSLPIDAIPTEICPDSWPFDWSKVDVPGSPGLSRLFKGLEIESSHVPPLHLDEPDADTPSCLSKSEIQKVFNTTKETASEVSHSPLRSQTRRYCTSLERGKSHRSPQYPWRNIEGVFCGYTISPLMEIYVFPPSPPRNHYRKASRAVIPLWTEYQRKETELKFKFAKLKQQLPEDNPILVAVMEDLAQILWEANKYAEAEAKYRELVDIYGRNSEPNNIKVLETCLKIINSVRRQGYFSKAKSLIEILRSAFARLVQPNHPLALEFAIIDAKLADKTGFNKESERICREVLQITLSSYGLRHERTISAISALGIVLTRRREKGGALLSRTAVELSLEELDERNEVVSVAMGTLAWALNYNGAAEKSYNMSTKAVEQFHLSFGQDHERVMYLRSERAWSMMNMGMLTESEALFRDMLSFYSLPGAERSRVGLADVWCGLAEVLSEKGCLEEATTWFEKSFHMKVSYGGAAGPSSVATCYQLANCYEGQGRLNDALAVYRQTIQKIREFGQDPGEEIPKLELEISRIEERLEQIVGSSGSDGEGSEYHPSVDGEERQREGGGDIEAERLEQDVVSEDEEQHQIAGEPVEGEKDDWTAFLVEDFPTP